MGEGEGAPLYFTNFLKEYRNDNKRNKDDFSSIKTDVTRIDGRLDKAERERKEENRVIRTAISSLTTSISAPDRCEIRISGIPIAANITNIVATEAVLQKLELSHLTSHIIELRNWNPRPLDADSAASSSAPTEGNDRLNYREVVVKFVSTVVCNLVLSKAGKLRDVKVEDLFQCGGAGKVFLNQLYPPEVYSLFKDAMDVSKTLNYVRPIVRSNVVYMRPTIDKDHFPVYSKADLVRLPARPKRTDT